VVEFDRGAFLRRSAGGLIAVTTVGLLPAVASAQGPQMPYQLAIPDVLTPEGDDAAYLSFATVGERAARDVYAAAYRQSGTGLSGAERRHIHQVSQAKRAHIMRLDAALGSDAPLPTDFVTVLPEGAVDTRARIVKLAEQLETLLARVYLTGVGFAQDPATRVFLGRLLAYDAEQIAWLRSLGGHASPGGLLGPIDLEPAGNALDQFLATPDFPG
jgi:hypothetical protein